MNVQCDSLPFLYVCTSQIDSNSDPPRYALWYKIDIKEMMDPFVILKSEYTSPSKKPQAPLYTKSSRDCHAWSGFAACGSKLYMFGGDLDCLDVTSDSQGDVFYYDTAHPSNWQKYPLQLNATRHDPVTITIKNCVYIFGSISRPSRYPNPWAEVLDSNRGTIKPLDTQPPEEFLCNGFITFSAVVDEKKILLCTAKSCYGDLGKLLYYHVSSGRWEDVSESHFNFFEGAPVSSMSRRSAVIGGVLYTYYCKKVYAYDLDNQEWFRYPVLGLLEEDASYYEYDDNMGFVLNLGNGELCVGACSSFPAGGERRPKMLINYAVFKPICGSGISDDRTSCSITPLVHSKGYHVLDGLHFVDAAIM